MTPASTFTRLLPALLATAALSGCAVYPAPGYGPYESYGAYGQPYGVSTSPGLVSGSVIYAQPVGGGGYYGNGNGYGYGAIAPLITSSFESGLNSVNISFRLSANSIL